MDEQLNRAPSTSRISGSRKIRLADQTSATQRDLALAYCRASQPLPGNRKDPLAAYKYTARGNWWRSSQRHRGAGARQHRALAGKPVMEGKGVLFKKFRYRCV